MNYLLLTTHYKLKRGGTLLMTLVFVSMFLVIFVALSGLVNRSYHESVLQAQDETAFHVAEAGLNYARWRLAHDPENFDPETRILQDQFGGDLGEYDLAFDGSTEGGTDVTITSIGTTLQQPGREVTLRAQYGRPSLARFASITNDDVWYGGTIYGPVHSNGGIRMDGASDSLMTSAKQQYACQPHHGCSSPFQTKDGIWGSGVIQELWEYPAPPIDYTALTVDLLDMKAAAQAAGTYYGPSGDDGYHIVFEPGNTYSIYRVTSKQPPVRSWFPGEPSGFFCSQWPLKSHDIQNEVLISTQAVPSGGIIYIEDVLWVNGDIEDRVTVAAGVFPDTPPTNADIIINGNISYGGVRDGSRVFGAVAQRHVLIPWSGAPDNLVLDGAFVASNGRFGRRYYPQSCGSQAHALKTSLLRYGMIGSDEVPVTAWVNGSQQVISGYREGSSEYDANLLYGPPPYFPTSSQYQFISWEEVQG